MARKLRIEYRGAIYHLMNRGDRREPMVRQAVEDGTKTHLNHLLYWHKRASAEGQTKKVANTKHRPR